MLWIDILTYTNIIIMDFVLFFSCFLIAAAASFSFVYLQKSVKTYLSSITCVDLKNTAGLTSICIGKMIINLFLSKFHTFKGNWLFLTNCKNAAALCSTLRFYYYITYLFNVRKSNKNFFNFLFLSFTDLWNYVIFSFNFTSNAKQWFYNLFHGKVSINGLAIVPEYVYYLMWGFGSVTFLIVAIKWVEWNNVFEQITLRAKIKLSFVTFICGLFTGAWKLRDYVSHEKRVNEICESIEKSLMENTKEYDKGYIKVLEDIKKTSSEVSNHTSSNKSINAVDSSQIDAFKEAVNSSSIFTENDLHDTLVGCTIAFIMYLILIFIIEPLFPNFNLKYFLNYVFKKSGIDKNEYEEWKMIFTLFFIYVNSYIAYFYYEDELYFLKFFIFFWAFLFYTGALVLTIKMLFSLYQYIKKLL